MLTLVGLQEAKFDKFRVFETVDTFY